MPSRIHQTLRADRPHSPRVTNGAPLSVRIARGSPSSRNVRSHTGRARAPCTEGRPSSPTGRHQACALEQRARRARGRRVVHARVPRTEPVQHELWPPIRMRTPGREDQRGDALVGLRWTRMRCPTSILHPGAAFLSNPCHPFVARLPTDRRATTQRFHRVHAAPRLGKALFTLVQWQRLRPWHSNLRLLATGVIRRRGP